MIGYWVVVTLSSMNYYATAWQYDERYVDLACLSWAPVACFDTHEEAAEFATELNLNFLSPQAAK